MIRFTSRIVRLLAAGGLTCAAMMPLGIGRVAVASAGPPAAQPCLFDVGSVSRQGAAGTQAYFVTLVAANPFERCTTTVTTTVTVAPDPFLPHTAKQYDDIADNPLTETDTVTFTPGRLPPTVSVQWHGFACADPAVAGTLTFRVSGALDLATEVVNPTSCVVTGVPGSALAPLGVQPVSAVGLAPTPDGLGYRIVDQLGDVTARGDAPSGTGPASDAPVVGIQSAGGSGAWVAAADGGVFSIDDAPFFGSAGGLALAQPVMGMAPTPDDQGYWLVGSDGGVFTYGDAEFHGSAGALHLNSPVVGMAPTPDGGGYWLVAADGGVFAFGDAAFDGSLGGVALNAPIVGMAAGPNGGYWLVAADGGVFAFGGATFAGSAGGLALAAPVSGMAAAPGGEGYWLVGADGGVFAFGRAGFFGTTSASS